MRSLRRYRRRVAHEEIGLQIAPMIDVTLLLLFFFMLSGKLTKRAHLAAVRIPTASTAQPTDNQGERYVINIAANGDLFAGEQRVSSFELKALLRARFLNYPPLKLQVRADASTPALRIKELMAMAADAGAIEVLYAVRKP